MFFLSHACAEQDTKLCLESQENPWNRKFEIDYDYFSNCFWPIAAVKFKES